MIEVIEGILDRLTAGYPWWMWREHEGLGAGSRNSGGKPDTLPKEYQVCMHILSECTFCCIWNIRGLEFDVDANEPA
jgi:hypothetical protein